MRIDEIRGKPREWLFHGTDSVKLPRIIKHGLSPLQNDPSGHSGRTRLNGANRKPWIYLGVDANNVYLYGDLVLGVRIKDLDQTKLGPDDDDLVDILKTRARNRRWDEFTWKESLRLTGQCTYSGVIWPSMLYRIRRDGKGQPLI